MSALSCVVLVDKPVGPTSFDIVRVARRGVRVKVGHAGTLDPFASGLLVVLVGQATRISSLLMGLPKEYEFAIQFGAVSSTGDPTGELSATGLRATAREVVAVLERFLGRIRQRVPATSAVKVGGRPLYERAHRGEQVETPEREVTIYDLVMTGFDEETQVGRFVALVSSGTYIRALAADIGSAVGAGGYAASLRRTRVGGLDVQEALAVEELSPQRYAEGGQGILTLDQALAFLPGRELDAGELKKAKNGNELTGMPKGRFRAVGPDGLVAVYESDGVTARPLAVLADN